MVSPPYLGFRLSRLDPRYDAPEVRWGYSAAPVVFLMGSAPSFEIMSSTTLSHTQLSGAILATRKFSEKSRILSSCWTRLLTSERGSNARLAAARALLS